MSLKSALTALADAIRAKTGGTDTMTIDQMTSAVNSISVGEGGIDTSEATAFASDILSGKTAYARGSMITGTIETKSVSDLTASGKTVTVPAGYYASSTSKDVKTVEQAVPSVSVDSSGVINVTSNQDAGYVSAGTTMASMQLKTQSAQTIIPGTANKTISSGTYLTGAQTIKGDANLIPENIISGKTIFGVEGSHSSGIDASDATATAAQLLKDAIAYGVNGERITGTLRYYPKDGTTGISAVANSVVAVPIDSANKTHVRLDYDIVNPAAFLEGSGISLKANLESFGDASTADVLSGKTFTSSAGLKATGSIPSKTAATYTPGTADRTISSGQYLSGTQTIKGDANLVAENIKSGVPIFGVEGSYTSDATATASDIVSGKTAYVNGEKVAGNIYMISQGHLTFSEASVNNTNIQFVAGPASGIVGRLIGESSTLYMNVPSTEFGDATAADVAAGKTFTSSNGLQVAGTISTYTGMNYPADSVDEVNYTDGTQEIRFTRTSSAVRQIFEANSSIKLYTASSNFGDATAADVLNGKTFTSSAGLKVTGSIPSKTAATYTPGTADQTIASGQYLSGAQTVKGDANLVAGNIKSGVSIFGVAGTYEGSGSSGSGIQAQHITSKSDTITISGNGTVKVWGYGYYSSGTYSKTTYSFVGDGYYTASSYGTPSKTSATFSISNGNLSGLPSNISNLDVLVTIGI